MKKRWPRPSALATASLRMTPGLFVIGEMKCGTTSLYTYLTRHPQVLAPYRKEPAYFADAHARGLRWYRSQFPLRARPGALTFDASTYHFFHPLACRRIKAFAPEAKLILLLRDPADRALSQYHHSRATGREPLSFEEALDAEAERLRGEAERVLAGGDESFSHLHHSYATRGHYAAQLERWYESFPREQILVLASEELFARPEDVMRRVVGFLGLPPHDLSPYPVVNARSYEGMAPETRARLEAEFAPSNRRLAELLGRELWPAYPALSGSR